MLGICALLCAAWLQLCFRIPKIKVPTDACYHILDTFARYVVKRAKKVVVVVVDPVETALAVCSFLPPRLSD